MDTPTISAGHRSRVGTIVVVLALTIAASALVIQAHSIWSTHADTTHVATVEDTGAVVGPANPLADRTHAAVSYVRAEAKDLSRGHLMTVVRNVDRPTLSEVRNRR